MIIFREALGMMYWSEAMEMTLLCQERDLTFCMAVTEQTHLT